MLPTDAKARKDIPIYSGFIKYFPDAIAKVAELSRKGNDQHNPGKPLHWDRSKSGDELDALSRHLLDEAGGVAVDTDGVLHLTKCAWRAMAALQKAVEAKDVKAQPDPAVCRAETDFPSRWAMADQSGVRWDTVCPYTRAEVCARFPGQSLRRLPIGPLIEHIWHDWNGGEKPPCAGERKVEVELRDGSQLPARPASYFRWDWREWSRNADIVKWRLA